MKKELVLALALASAPFAASAGQLSYNYVEADWSRLTLDGGASNPEPGVTVSLSDADIDGFALNGSFEVSESFYLLGGYRSGQGETHYDVRVDTVSGPFFGSGDADVDAKQLLLGVGYHHALSEKADLLTELSYIDTQLDLDNDSLLDGTDLRVAVGIRGALAPNFEGWVKGQYTDGDAYDGVFGGVFGGQFKFNQTWGLVGEFEAGDDTTAYQIGVRASF